MGYGNLQLELTTSPYVWLVSLVSFLDANTRNQEVVFWLIGAYEPIIENA
jgi:hypothetical protein